jgi:single-strand DNA-binding protein
MRDREAALALGTRVAIAASRENNRDPVIWLAGQDYRAAETIRAARLQAVHQRQDPSGTTPNDNQITIVGNLVDAPNCGSPTPASPWRTCGVAVTQRIQQDGEWRDGDTSYLRVNVWRGQAEHLADSLAKGDRVMITGRLRQWSWETPEGERRSVTETSHIEELNFLEVFEIVARQRRLLPSVYKCLPEKTSLPPASPHERHPARGDNVLVYTRLFGKPKVSGGSPQSRQSRRP